MFLKYAFCRLVKKMRGVAVRDSRIHRTSKIESGSQIVGVNMGRYSYCGYDCKILNTDIGSFCSIADGVVIGGTQHPMEWVSTAPVFYKGRDSIKKKFSEFERKRDERTYIGSDVWIGERALIKSGVRIGNGAVIGMGSVVTHDVGDYEICAGNPAHVIKRRFDNELSNELSELKWWDFDDEKLSHIAQYVTEPDKFVEMSRK